MLVAVDTSGLKRSKWYEYVIRFSLGGLVTAIAGFLAQQYGPGFGGLFLAFPAILAASTTLVEKHEREAKEEKGFQGKYRGRYAAGADAAGAAMGSLGLMAFAVFVWKALPYLSAWMVISIATLIWALLSTAIWWLWKRNHSRRLVRALFTRHRPVGTSKG
jgi:hypothetical protein